MVFGQSSKEENFFTTQPVDTDIAQQHRFTKALAVSFVQSVTQQIQDNYKI